MILSHKYKFIFIKTNKTAGTSIEIALSRFCGPEDIITPISEQDEETRTLLGYPSPQNYLSPYRDYLLSDVLRLLLKREKKYRFFNHISADEIKKHVDEQVWSRYYKFCFERNPWDRIISLYYWHFRSEPRPSMAEFLATDLPLKLKRRGLDLYTVNGEIGVDKVCRYEDLNHELELFRHRVGIPEKIDLPRAKSQYRKDRRHYREILNNSEQTKIANLFNDEIRLFEYSF